MILLIIFIVLLSFLLVETFLHFWLKFLKKRFDLIVTSEDRYPHFDEKALKKFLETGYDSELGWVRKPNTSKKEIFLDEEKSYSIGPNGSRTNPLHEKQKTEVITVGDSYAFCREVNDDETWQHFLANKINKNVTNFGVGNYGMDQSLLRFKRELKNLKDKPQYAVMAVVPETIQRNLACWKHYSEYGNTFAFKPRFILENHQLKLVNNFVDTPDKFYNLKKIIPRINKYDHFYKDFEKDVLSFPYLFNVFRKKKTKQIFSFSLARLFEALRIDWRKFKSIKTQKIKEEIKGTIKRKKELYSDEEARKLSLEILKEFASVSRKNKLEPIFMMMPQEDDLRDIIEKKSAYYQDFLDEASKFVFSVDLVKPLLKLKNPLDVFFQKRYSNDFVVINGHYNSFGNKLVADELIKAIKKLK